MGIAGDADQQPRKQQNQASSTSPRKLAIFLAYLGSGYKGMQKNPGARTIESELEHALFLSGAISGHRLSSKPRISYDFARSARTDKGVSAVGQVVSGAFFDGGDTSEMVRRLNSYLPPQIRVMGVKNSAAEFNAKKCCERRRYVYLLPVFALDATKHRDRESVREGSGVVKCEECSERGRKVAGVMGRKAKVFGTIMEARRHFEKGNGVVVSSSVSMVQAEISPFEKEKIRNGSELGKERRNLVSANGGILKPKFFDEAEVCVGKEEFKHNGRGEENILSDDAFSCASKLEKWFSKDLPTTEHDMNKDLTLAGTVGLPVVLCSLENLEIGKSESEHVKEIDGLHLSGSLIGPDTSIYKHGEKTVVERGKVGSSVVACDIMEQTVPRSGKFQYGEKEERFKSILQQYVGTHNFHNLTTRMKAEDPSAWRHILSIDASTVVDIDGIEFVQCEIVGQSFMLHQIRKMIGLAVAVVRNCTSESLVDLALRQDVEINVPTAPEVGLYLEECLFPSYNKKWKGSHEELSLAAHEEETENFKMKYIYPHISAMEKQEGAVALWLHSLNRRNYPDFGLAEPSKA